MAGLLDLFGGGGSDPMDIYGDLFTEKQRAALRDQQMTQGLLNAAAVFSKAGQASRLPVSIPWGEAAQALGGSGDEAMARMLKGMQVAEEVRKSRQERAIVDKISPIVEALVARGIPRQLATQAATQAVPAAPGAGLPPDIANIAGPAAWPAAKARPSASQGYSPPGGMFVPPPPVGDYGAPGAETLPDLPPQQSGLLNPPAYGGSGGGLPGQGVLASLGGGEAGVPLPFGQGSPGSPDLNNIKIEQLSGEASPAGGREGRVAFWTAQGAPQHVAEGIADRVKAESGFRSDAMGDQGTSGGLYQHHADRLARLKNFAAQQNRPWTDPGVQDQFAATEVRGGDAIAAKGWPAILAAPDRQTAATLWDKYFERSKYGPGAGGGFSGRIEPLGGDAAPAGDGTIPGLNITPQGLAALNAMLKMGGIKSDPFGSLLETYYKSPDYLMQAEAAKQLGGLPFEGPKAAAIAKAQQQYIQQNAAHQSDLDIAKDLITKGGLVQQPDGSYKQITSIREGLAAVEAAKPTGDIKEYNFYAQQTADSGGIPKPFAVWDVERRKASATSINTSEGFEAAQTKARVGVDAKIAQDVAEQAITGRRLMPVLDELSYLADRTPEGWRGTLAPTVGKTLATLGVPVPAGASNAEAFQALAQRLVPIVREPGATSQGEMALYLQAGPSLSGTANGRRMIIDINRAMIQRSQDIAKTYRENIGSPNLYEKLAALDKPLFTDEQRAEMQRATAAPLTPPPPPTGASGAPRELRWNPATGRAE